MMGMGGVNLEVKFLANLESLYGSLTVLHYDAVSFPVQVETLYQLGRTKVFFRAGQIAHLERLRQSRLHSSGVLLQKNVRAWLARRRYLRLRKTAVWLQKLTRGCLARR